MEPDATDEPDNSLRRRHAASAESQPPRSPSPGNTTSSGISTWQDQLREARLGIARKVQEQQQQDQLPGAEVDGDQHEEVEPANTSARRESVTTEDGQDDAEVAEMLRPSRPATPSDQQFASTEKLERNDESDSAQQTQAGTAEHGTDTSGADKICRICFDSEDEELGKLFSPCRCRGTSRYVHIECLAAWRKAAQNSSSFYRCETCAFEYKFRRTLAGNLINSKLSVFSLTIVSFLFLTWAAGFLANSLLSMVDSRSSLYRGTTFDEFFVSDHILIGEGVRESLSFVTHQLEDSRWSTARKIAQQAHLQEHVDEGDAGFSFFGLGGGRRQGATSHANLGDPGLWARAVLHMTKGASLLGLLSVFYTYIAATFVSPLGRTLFRALRPAGGRRRAGDNSASISQVVIVIVIVLGIARAVRQVYRGVRWVSRRLLSRLEDLVLEVN
ncbi:E3 ubiquitin-protein ligase SSM4 [Sporobolomyces koalae]|uniref:E3 ubiquitin-protein ligase SSM4 n=1 Tax=Sporobolomyces koalae TaxID=500713 RepID=UPI00316BAF87